MFAKCLKANDKGLHLPKNKQKSKILILGC
jgi:hypothetical protein